MTCHALRHAIGKRMAVRPTGLHQCSPEGKSEKCCRGYAQAPSDGKTGLHISAEAILSTSAIFTFTF